VPEFTSQDMEIVRRCAQRLVDIINESKEFARTSNNPATKISRLQLAQDKLKELKEMATQYPFLKLFSLDEVEVELSEIALKIQKDGETEKTFRTYNINSKELYEDNSDIIKGRQFVATMQLHTPLKYLEMHGQILDLKSEPPQVPEAHGAWLPALKSWKELGISLKEAPIGTMASDIGQIPANGGEYLRFLKAFRAIVESNKSIEERSKEILSLPEQNPEFAEFLSKHQCLQPDTLPKYLSKLKSGEK